MTIHLHTKINTLCKQQKDLEQAIAPLFYRIYNENELADFTLLLDKPGLMINDHVLDQVKELMKISHPTLKLNAKEQEEAAIQHIKPLSIEDYGVWVYYPWSNRLVHIVDEKEFIELRTSRNQYKITREERELLAQKKIGIIGLSVGQSVSITLAMERVGGELRLADFDVLELTNLNRIRTGIHNLGLPKVHAVAREIAEIDPFLTVKCFGEGLSESNMDAFFTGGGKLDLLVEESDGFDIKILSRYKAKELQIPVIMEASDRCTVDVERFDLEPNRSILHGMVDHLNMDTLKSLKTTEDKIPYLLTMVGLETSSDKLKASLLEIDQTITTWPQLASSVTMGGGITADVSRRILLNTYTDSGRYHIDIEELVSNKTNKIANSYLPPISPSVIDFKNLSKKFAVDHTTDNTLNESDIEKLVRAGCAAPSGGNSQPWRWVYKQNTLLLFKAFDDHHSLLGFNNLSSYLALGAASENVTIQADELNLDTKITPFPDQTIPDLVASFTFSNKTSSSPNKKEFAPFIHTRLTNRKSGERQQFTIQELHELKVATEQTEGVELTFFTEEQELNQIGNLLGEMEQIRLLEKQGHADFINEIRWSEKEAVETRDGIDLRTINLTNSELAGFKVSKSYSVINLVRQWKGGGAFKKLTKKSVVSSGAIGCISIAGKEKLDYYNGGRAIEQLWLLAQSKNIAFQPMAASVFMYARLLEGKGELISEEGCNKLFALRDSFEKTFRITPNKKELFIFRINKISAPEITSLRKSLKETYCILKNES